MRHIITIVFFLFSASLFSQVNNVYANAGIAQTIGPPTFKPGAKGSIVAIDTVSGTWYISRDRYSVNWLSMGDRVENISGCSAPVGTPNKYNSELVINACTPIPKMYQYVSGTWLCLNCASSGTITTDATLTGDGVGTPLGIAQQSASTSQGLSWTGATWLPSWGNPYTFVTSGATITSAVNEVLIGTISADIVLGLPVCNSGLDTKHFKFIRNGTDAFSVTIDPNGSQTFYDLTTLKIIYGKLSVDCTCRFSAGTGTWFYDNF